jgi:predicted ATPase
MADDREPPKDPSTIGRYELRGELGRGGMGIVHLAEDSRLGRLVALKVLPSQLSTNVDARERFEREARILANLNHPNIAIIHSLESDGDQQFITLERIEGETLDARIARGPIPCSEALAIGQQIVSALAAAHGKSVVHRDLKPTNIMITADERVKVLDFGLARRIAKGRDAESLRRRGPGPDAEGAARSIPQAPTIPEGGGIDAATIRIDPPAAPPDAAAGAGDATVFAPGPDTETSIGIVGTPGYMSPEQIWGQPIDARADVFAFGCVLFECLSGERSFGGPGPSERLASTLWGKPHLDGLPAETPSSVRELISDCLAMSAEDRPFTDVVRQRLQKEIELLRLQQESILPEAATATSEAAASIPRRIDAFVGRSDELGRISVALDESQIVTLTGTGGTGKSRLAIEAAGAWAESGHGVVGWVDLVRLNDPELVAETVATSIGVEIQEQISPLESLRRWFQAAPRLLVIDNCEHLVEPCADLADDLLASEGPSRILATSREALGIDGEHTISIDPLEVPSSEAVADPDALASVPSVELFLRRATSARKGFTIDASNAGAITEICRRLDGIPLAIELAATRVGALPVEQIARRLDDRFKVLTKSSRRTLPRHRTLRAAVDWSHDLLEEEERCAFRRLSVFSEGWTLEAAEEVIWRDDAERWSGLDLLTQLIEKSLIVMRPDDLDGARYSMLETIRLYAREKLEEAGEAEEFRRRHAEKFASEAAEILPRTWSSLTTEVQSRITKELGNHRIILTRGLAGENPAIACELAASLGAFWEFRGLWTEGRYFARRLLERDDVPSPTSARVALGRWAGYYSQHLGELDDARTFMEKALEVARELDDPAQIAPTLHTLGSVAQYENELDQAEACFSECREIYERTGNRSGLAAAVGNLGGIAVSRNDIEGALRLFGEAGAVFKEIGHLRGYATSLHNSGVLAQQLGHLDRASSLLEEALGIRRELDDSLGVATSLVNIATCELARGNGDRADEAMAEALPMLNQLGERYHLLNSIEGIASVAATERQWERAARLLAAARVQREKLGLPKPEAEREEIESIWREVIDALSPDARSTVKAWSEAATIDAIVRFALDRPSAES